MFKTHLAFGLLIALFVSEFLGLEEKLLFISVCVVSSILPDIDTPFSKIGRKFPPISWLFNILFGHRGLMHTIYFPLLIYFIFRAFGQHLFAGAFFLGYMSHLIIDMLNIKGIYFFFPLNRTRLNGFIKSGGVLEWVLFVLILVGIFWFLFF
jgi:inner membrane protein|tara:strand:+ start:2196 stop:2651 length:456 start_codon:yes stop_codon:yes gene_type:complete